MCSASGNYAYIADNDAGLIILDVSTPSQPLEVGYSLLSRYATCIVVDYPIAYVCDAYDGLHIYNISQPDRPASIDLTQVGDTTIWGETVVGGYAYLSSGQIIDISNPYGPHIVGNYHPPTSISVFVSNGQTGYSSGETDALLVWDLANPELPQLDHPAGLHYSSILALSGNTLFSDGVDGLTLIDIHAPVFPIPRKINYLPVDRVFDIYPLGDMAYVTAGTSGMYIIDATDPADPQELGHFDSPGFASEVTVSGTIAYLADGSSGVSILSVADPANPLPVGSYNTPGTALDVALIGHKLYIADGSSGLQVLDVSDPANPIYLGSLNTASNASYLAAYGSYVLLCDGYQGLRV